jgi:hypothetical protein
MDCALWVKSALSQLMGASFGDSVKDSLTGWGDEVTLY